MLSQKLQLKLQQKLSPQQIQLMKLLQVPTMAIEQRIKQELEENPALEEGRQAEDDLQSDDDLYSDVYEETGEAEKEFDFSDYVDDDETPSYKLNISNKGKDDEERNLPLAMGISFIEQLQQQFHLQNLTDKQRLIGDILIGNIDEAGYLRRDLEAIEDDLAFTYNVTATREEIEQVLRIIQDLDPPGIAARDLRECLLLQLYRKNREDKAVENAIRILENDFEAFSKKHYDKLKSRLDLSDEELKEAVNEITRLNPKPGGTTPSGSTASVIVPDFILTVQDGEIQISLNSRNAPELSVSRQYAEMIEDFRKKKGKVTKSEREAIQFVKQKLDSAKWFIDAIKQRQQTLLLTMNAIADYQKEFFLTGDETKLKPMILKDIADRIGMDISTVSRVANSKYVQTPYGTYPLKYFFSESLKTLDGKEVSTREVKNVLRELVDNEDKKHPVTDEKLCELLKDHGYNIARRTVAKYREQLGIPVARLRKQI